MQEQSGGEHTAGGHRGGGGQACLCTETLTPQMRVCVCVLSVPVCVRAPLCRWRHLGMSVGLYAGVYPCLHAHMCECVMVYMCAYTPVCMAVCVHALVCGVGQLY